MQIYLQWIWCNRPQLWFPKRRKNNQGPDKTTRNCSFQLQKLCNAFGQNISWVKEMTIIAYFCRHFSRKCLASGERCSGIGGCDFVVPTWNRRATWKDFVSVINNKKINFFSAWDDKIYLLILLAPWWFTSSHFNDCIPHSRYLQSWEIGRVRISSQNKNK